MGHLRSFVYDLIVTTKYKKALLIFLNIYTHALYSTVVTSTVHTFFPPISCSSVFILAQTM